MVYHPYFMDYLEKGVNEEKKWIMASLYTEDSMKYGIKSSNLMPIMINSDNLYTPNNWVELHVHKTDENDPHAIAVSPNNAAFLMNMSLPMVSFYSVAIEYLENKKKINVLITHHCIIDEL